MNNIGSGGIATISLLTSFLLIGATTSSVMFGASDDLAIDAEQIANDALNEITTYLKIDDVIGKYYTSNGICEVEKIVILVKPFTRNTINMSDVIIKICNNNNIMLLDYSGYAVESNSGALFEHHVWATINNTFGLIVTLDKDRSLLDYGIMNGDIAFIAVKLSDQFAMGNRESLAISIIPTKGITSSVFLETPSFHSSNIISFWEM